MVMKADRPVNTSHQLPAIAMVALVEERTDPALRRRCAPLGALVRTLSVCFSDAKVD